MSDLIKHVTDASLDADVLNAEKAVLVDYWAEWSGPSKAMASALGDVAEEYDSTLTVAKLNIDENTETPTKYGITEIPTLMLFKNGEVKAAKTGALTKSQISEFLNTHL
ncbi:thioredoxin [Streptomyces sp. PanSC19]|uniref:thioredoxin TrxA n=1 Tax=Streptomyces sp. PanSC19 TaxID=1520455 RepID=UPI000F4A3AF6|nr:thioredoxin TrxA [Streptomyces sp. PanSC19]ROQ33933.1 thioredoxin [Streptomyces sp. PanSC19]